MPVIDVASQSIQNIGQGASPPEIYEELWWYSGSNFAISSSVSSSGTNFIEKGSTGTNAVKNVLLTLSSNWPPSTQFAFECSLMVVTGLGYAALWDVTSNSLISLSEITASSASYTVIRSGKFTIPQSHQLAITLWSGGSGSVGGTDASLIVFPS